MLADSSPSRLILASRNLKKCAEMASLLAPYQLQVLSIDQVKSLPEIEEDGQTFAENAAKKACVTAQAVSEWTLGEDSGLVVDALKGAPGIFSARYSGLNATDEANNQKLMDELSEVPFEKRTAHYVCHIAISDPAGVVHLNVTGTCQGIITTEPRGSNGFGYDPYFLIPEYHRTFGELSVIVKEQLSHRARAFARLVPALLKLLKKCSIS